MQENQTPVMSTPDSQHSTAEQAVTRVVQTNDQRPKSNSFLVVLLSVLLLLSVSIAGFFAFQTQKLVKELTLLKSLPSPTIIPTVQPTETPETTSSPISTGSATIQPLLSSPSSKPTPY